MIDVLSIFSLFLTITYMFKIRVQKKERNLSFLEEFYLMNNLFMKI